MEFLKKHYEKVVLGMVLVGLAVAVAFLPFKAASERQKLEEQRSGIIHRPVKPLTNLDLTVPEDAAKRLSATLLLDLSTSNRLFNPMPWQKAADGRLIKVEARNIGPEAVIITKLTPLFLTLSFESLSVAPDGKVLYTIGIENPAATNPRERGKRSTMCEVNQKKEKDPFTLVGVKGKADDPDQVQLVLQMHDTGQQVVVAKDKPFRRPDAYMVDLKYAPENLTWLGRRKLSQPPLRFNGEEYNILDVKKDEVVLSSKSNQKKWTIKYSAAS